MTDWIATEQVIIQAAWLQAASIIIVAIISAVLAYALTRRREKERWLREARLESYTSYSRKLWVDFAEIQLDREFSEGEKRELRVMGERIRLIGSKDMVDLVNRQADSIRDAATSKGAQHRAITKCLEDFRKQARHELGSE